MYSTLHFRLGMFDPAAPDEVEFFGPVFYGHDPSDLLAMKLTLEQLKPEETAECLTGIFLEEEEPEPVEETGLRLCVCEVTP